MLGAVGAEVLATLTVEASTSNAKRTTVSPSNTLSIGNLRVTSLKGKLDIVINDYSETNSRSEPLYAAICNGSFSYRVFLEEEAQ